MLRNGNRDSTNYDANYTHCCSFPYQRRVPRRILRLFNEHGSNTRHENAHHYDGSEKSPRDLPIDSWSVSCHLLDILCEPALRIYVIIDLSHTGKGRKESRDLSTYFSWPYTKTTEIISMRATMTRPMVPAKLSNIFSQYSPAPVQKMSPTKKHTVQTTPETDNRDKYLFQWMSWPADC